MIRASGIGAVDISEVIGGKIYRHELQNVLFVPELRRNLFSVSTVNKRGYSYHAYNDRCEFRRSNGEVIASGTSCNGLYLMNFKAMMSASGCNVAHTVKSTKQQKFRLWHERFGHVNVRAVKATCENLNIRDIGRDANLFCEP